jgi:phosphorylcholine metabolism protein LicD
MLKELKLISIIVLIILIFKFLFNIFKNKESNEVKIDMAKKKQDNFRRTLEDMANILNYNNIPFHLHSGTALGAIREKRFIPNDSDIDIAMFNKDKVKNLENLILKNNNYTLVHKLPYNSKEEDIMEFSFKHIVTKIKIDIFFIVEENDKYKIFSYNGLCDNKPNKRCEFVNSKYKLNDILFYGKNYKVPEIKFLEEQYGEDWLIPKNFNYDQGLDSGYKNMVRENFDIYRINDKPCNQLTKRCDYPYTSDKKTTSYSCCKNHLIELLSYLVETFNKHKVTYFLDYGTLLGCMRNNSFIPWDTDIDISIITEDLDSIMDIIKENNKGYNLIKEASNLYRLNYSKINLLHVDISIRKKNKKDIYYDKYINWGIHENDLFPLTEKIFEDIVVNVPKESKKYLEKGYGKNCITEPKTKIGNDSYVEKF